MAWYRVGGGGLPPQIKTDMNNVLNKKMGTSGQTYPPTEWADDVNLMGMLEEKTIVSSPIVSFSDGADDVPTKSLVVTIPPTLSGVSVVNEKQTGRNLLMNEKYQGASTRVNIGQTDDDYSLHLKVGTYTLSATSLVQMRAYYRTSTGGSNILIWSTYGTSGSGTFTLSEDSDVRIWLYKGDGLSVSDVQTFQLEIGSTAHDYEPYQTPTQYTASLGRTIYGGQVDIVNGTGTDEYEILTLAVADMNNSENYPGWRNCGVREIIGAEVSSSVTDGVSTVGQYWSYNTLGSNDILYLPRGQYNNMTQTDWKTNYPDLVIQFAIKKATPTDFTFTGQEVPTRLGYNAFWSEQGDTEVTYRSSGTVYNYPEGEEASF